MNREEEKIQADCFKWFHNTYHSERKMFFHVDNNSWNAVIGAKKKALGVTSGVSDLIWITPGNTMIFIEVKIRGGKQSDDQIEFEQKVKERGHIYIIIYSFEEFKNFVWRIIGK